MQVLVTGGAGYIGSHTAKLLAVSGHEPIVLDNLCTGHRWAVKSRRLVKAAVGNTAVVRDAIRRYGITAVVHLAGSAYVGESVQNPRKYFRNNVVQTIALLDALVAENVKHIVFSSSCTTYGIPDCVPIAEDHPQRPISPYGESKLFVERVLAWYGRAYDLRWLSLRYFNAAGADPDGELGEVHAPETHLIPLALGAALGQEPALQVFGTDFDTVDGTAVRDYVHVSDLAAVHMLGLEYLQGGGLSASMNIGTNRGYSVREVVLAIERICGVRVPLREVNRRPGDPACLIADSTLAQRKLGWAPRYSELDTILATAWRWQQRLSI